VTAGTQPEACRTWLDDLIIALRDAVAVAGICFAVGLLINLVHPKGIPFIADQEYDIFAPCPEPGGEVTPMPANEPLLFANDTFIVDARSKQEFRTWRFRESINVPYDYLEPTPGPILQHLTETIAKSRSKRVVVYGDGDIPDTGDLLARDISGHGTKHVFFVEGGAPALRSSEQPGGDR
jgi:predicted sulfurtransferase